MKLYIFVYFIILFYLQQCDSENVSNGKEFIYEFTSSVVANNIASDKIISKWGYSGELIIQEFEDQRIFKLNNLKTTIFNGDKSNENNALYKEISNDKKIVTEPFGVYYNDFINMNISVLPDDEIWSYNMKKAIASIFFINTSITEDYTNNEELIYGICEVKTKVINNSDNTKSIYKIIDHFVCSDEPESQWTNVNWDTLENSHSSIQPKTQRNYVISPESFISSVQSISNITFQTSPDVKSTLHINQNQNFKLIKSSDIFTKMDISSNSEIKNIIFETGGIIKSENKTQLDYINDFENAYDEYKKFLNQKPLQHLDIRSQNHIDDMLGALLSLDKYNIAILGEASYLNKDHQLSHIFLSLLPYLGTSSATHLIKEIYKEDALNDLLLIKLLIIFPDYLNNIDEELLKVTQVLLTTNSAENQQVKDTAVLSFASILGDAIRRELLDEKITEKYVNKIYKRYLQVENYENILKYVLALINVDNGLDTGTIMNMFDNPTESRHIKSFMIYGFKYRFTELGNEVFPRFWPLVQNATEDFEVRVAALDLLFSCDINEKQFNEIVDYFDKDFEDPFNEHLANYVFTTIYSLRNTTGFRDNTLSEWATKRLETDSLSRHTRSWTTGNYKIAFTDENSNFGVSIDVRLVADPITNAINIIQIDFNHCAMSLHLNSYHIYLKIEGLLDQSFVNKFFTNRENSEVPIVALLELIQHFQYKLKEGVNLNIDFVLFSNNRALFGMHIDDDNIDTYKDNPLFMDLLKLLIYYNSVSYPIFNQFTLASDLGTSIDVRYNSEQIMSHELDNAEELLFSDEEIKQFTIKDKMKNTMQLNFVSLNPLLETEISTYKVHYDFKTFDLGFSLNTSSFSLSWKHQNDSFNWILDNLIGTNVNNKDVLKEYCLTCDDYAEIPVGEANSECVESQKDKTTCEIDTSIWREKMFSIPELGFKFNVTSTKDSEATIKLENMNKYGENELTKIVNSHQSNAFAFPLAKPFLYFWHLILYYRYLDNDLSRLSIRSVNLFDVPYESKMQLSFGGDTVYYDNDPIDGSELKISFELTNNELKDNRVLTFINASLNTATKLIKTDKKTIPHVEHQFSLTADLFASETVQRKLCINRKMVYPERRVDKLSLESFPDAKGVTTVSWNNVKSLEDECPPYFIKITEIDAARDHQQEKIKQMNEYKTCKQESTGLKYTPPTKSCIAVHKAISLYTDYSVYLEFLHGGERPSVEAKNLEELKNNKIFEYHHTDDSHINITISRGIFRLIEIEPKDELLNYIETSMFVDILSADPTAVAYNDADVTFGISRTCDITTNQLKTFTGKYKNIFEETPAKDIVAFIECINTTRSGLTVHKIDDKSIIFKFWSGDHVIKTILKNNKLKVMLNGKERLSTDTEQNNDIKIYFLADDVLYITNNLTEIYYTTEGISMKMISLANNYICGKCSLV